MLLHACDAHEYKNVCAFLQHLDLRYIPVSVSFLFHGYLLDETKNTSIRCIELLEGTYKSCQDKLMQGTHSLL